jgi:hypothetical protein
VRPAVRICLHSTAAGRFGPLHSANVAQADATRLAALAWAAGLLGCARRRVLAHTPLLLPPLLAALAAPSPTVATEAIRALVSGARLHGLSDAWARGKRPEWS